MQIGGGTDHQVAVVRFNAAQLGHAGKVDHGVKIFMQLGHPQADVGAAGHQLRSGSGGAGGQQFGQAGGQQVGFLSLANGRLDLRQRGLEPVLVKPHRRKAGHLLRRVQDGPVAGAAAQVARQLGLRQFARNTLALRHMVLVHAKQAHDKAGRAKAALRAVALHHRLLRRMQRTGGPALQQRVGRQVFHGPQGQPLHRMGHAYAAVDGLEAQRTTLGLAQNHGAGAAVAFAAAFLGAGAAQVFAQQLQQGAGGWYIAQRHHLAAPDELNGLIHRLGHKHRHISCMVEQR